MRPGLLGYTSASFRPSGPCSLTGVRRAGDHLIVDEDEVVARAFDLGAADYVVKPFSPTELAARIRAALRKRAAPELAEPSRPYVRGELTVDYALRRVVLAGNPVALTVIEYRMLVERRAGADPRAPAATGLGTGQGPGLRASAQHRQEAAPQAGRRPGQSQPHLRRTQCRIPDGGGGRN